MSDDSPAGGQITAAEPQESAPALARRWGEILGAYAKLGCISFGGPIAHLSYLRDEFVARRRWLTDEAFADLVALCNFLPGPASSQVVFALGLRRGGVVGGFLASLGFTTPSAALMILFAYGVVAVGDLSHAGWLHGLKLAAVAVVAQAVWGMGKRLCPDRTRITLALAAAGLVLITPGAIAQIGVIVLGAAVGWLIYRAAIPRTAEPTVGLGRSHLWPTGVLAVCIALLFVLPLVATATGQKSIAVFDSFYRAGALVFGGGHVVLPLLRAEVVPTGWIHDDAFLAGYGAAQAVPGPLFTFAAYLGTVITSGHQAWLGGLMCLLAIFLPGWMLVGGSLPLWHLLRDKSWAQAALRGANAAVVGVLLAALYNPVWLQGVRQTRDVTAALVAFALLEIWRIPAWLVVALAAIAGQWWLG